MKNFLSSALLLGALTATSALADNPNYSPGDLILFFQQENGPQTIYANLGNAAAVFRGAAAGATGGTNSVNFLNINSALTTAFGAGWASDPTVYAGLAAVWGTSNSTSDNSLQDGDPNRTIYVSQSRDNVGTLGQAGSAGYVVNTNGGMTTGSSNILQMSLVYDVSYTNAVEVVPVGTSSIDNQNTFFAPAQQGPAFGIFASGVQQVGSAGSFGTFGAAGSVEFALDLYRILAKNNAPGQVGGIVREGSYEGTVTINGSGQVSFIAQGAAPTSNYDTWTSGFPLLVTATDKLPETDFDNDGFSNLEEFVLNGNPSVSGQAIAPTLDASSANFVFNFNRRADSTAEVTQIFEYSTNLVDWSTRTPITIPTTPGTVGFVTVGANIGTAPNELQAVTLSIPKGADTKLFGRLKVVK